MILAIKLQDSEEIVKRQIPRLIELNSLEIEPHKYSKLSLNKIQRQFNRESIVFTANSIGIIGHPIIHPKREPCPKPYTL